MLVMSTITLVQLVKSAKDKVVKQWKIELVSLIGELVMAFILVIICKIAKDS